MTDSLKSSNIHIDGFFLNVDAGFDAQEFRKHCYICDVIDNIDQNKRACENDVSFFDKLLYKQQFVVERINAWLNTFKSIPVRFETKKHIG
ncbi:hypothetical protein GQR60_03615 [Labilibaculum sp. A4]|uniref:hypothetical protein n=1 Tax=Labilibaculum euxinus TaxID=2686357 RepID=UPI000F6257BF|nr:hypothetical protein [Labilibaculum euxinus]MDQ1770359.1 hypothetical protein [Labilibaculum euxinus]MWN75421.1 hypothetical protein [Labilibaculum euxinus]